ncbi:MAG: DUF541 domain-containing protein [Phycisphaera sp.]|nr:DUF541 domain-containing protein [Phycisphaera sp.]
MSTSRINLFWLIIFTLTLPIAVVISTHLARASFEKVKLRGQTITVKGYAEKPITSDYAEWSARVIARDADRTEAYRLLAEQMKRVQAYLDAAGFKAEKVEMSPVCIAVVYQRDEKGNRTNAIERFELSQGFAISGREVQAITDVARKASTLIADGVELDGSSPTYLYTKLNAMKLTMLAEATKNARERAEQLVSSSGNHLGALRSASQGVFQITPALSTEVSGEGYNDTSSLDKMIKSVVTVEYAIE